MPDEDGRRARPCSHLVECGIPRVASARLEIRTRIDVDPHAVDTRAERRGGTGDARRFAHAVDAQTVINVHGDRSQPGIERHREGRE